jgi:hypothetical protein
MINRPLTELNINVYRERILDTFLEFVQGDTNTNVLNINLLNGKTPIDITNFTITITFKKADNNVVVGNVTVVDALQGKISYSMGTQEIAYPGKVIATIEMYEGQARFTSCQFMFMVRAELNNGSAIPSQTIYPVFEQMIANGNDVIAGCQTATNNANTATDNANVATTNANEATENASNATSLANEATNKANIATENANTKAVLAEEKANFANEKGNYASLQGDYNRDRVRPAEAVAGRLCEEAG